MAVTSLRPGYPGPRPYSRPYGYTAPESYI